MAVDAGSAETSTGVITRVGSIRVLGAGVVEVVEATTVAVDEEDEDDEDDDEDVSSICKAKFVVTASIAPGDTAEEGGG